MFTTPFLFAIALIFGLLVGSFLNVCIYRIPRRAKYAEGDYPLIPPEEVIEFTTPRRSVCPKCRTQLHVLQNIPLLSWIMLRGRCAFCSAPIPVRYPLVELATGVLALLTLYNFGATVTGFAIFTTLAVFLVLAIIDYDHYILPDCLTLSGTVVSLIIGVINHFFGIFDAPIVATLWEGLLGSLLGGGFLFIVSEVYLRLRGHEGLGLGDVKLMLMTGALFGPAAALQSIFLGSLLGSFIGGFALLISKKGARHPIPFGPFLIAGAVAYIFWGIAPMAYVLTLISAPLSGLYGDMP